MRSEYLLWLRRGAAGARGNAICAACGGLAAMAGPLLGFTPLVFVGGGLAVFHGLLAAGYANLAHEKLSSFLPSEGRP